MAYLDENGLARFKSKLDDQLDERIEEQSEETSVLLTGKLNTPANVPQGKFLQTNENGEAVWGDGASSSTITTAVNNWLADNVAGGSTIAVDTSLNVTGAAAESKTVGTKLNNQILVQDSQPSSADNKIWIKETPQTEVEVPSYTEFTDLKSAIQQISDKSRNALFPLGYKDIITKNGTMDYNGITAEVSGNKIKLNGTCTAAIRLKLTNDIEYAHSVDSDWYNETIGVPNNSHKFIVAVSCLSGAGSGQDMQVVFYNSSGGRHPTRLMTPTSTNYSLGMKYSEEFNDLSELNCLCIYIKTGVTLNNVELQIGLYDIAELAKILDFADGDIIPQYYFTNNYLPNKITDIENIGVGLSVNSLRFVFNTDYHMAKNANISPALIKKIAEDTGIKTVIFNGDYMVSETTPLAGYSDICDFISLVTPLNEVADVHFATGNHEWNDPSASYSERRIGRGALIQLLNAYDSEITMLDPFVSNAFYIDFDIPKIRCYCIDMEYDATISMDTRKKMFASLLEVPEGYAVLVCSHGAMKNATNAEITGRFGQIMACCAAMNDGVSVTLNDVTYDFTNKARTFIGALTGHTHVDGYLIYDDRFPVIVTECDAWNAQESGGTRINGTVEEQAFEVVQIDVIAKRIYLTRIGHGNDRVFSFGETGAGLVT